MQNTYFDAADAPDVGLRIHLGPERVIMAAAVGDTEWGMFMFPSVWRLRDGRLVCAVTVGNDESPSNADYHYLWYLSDDDGAHWTHAVLSLDEAEKLMRQRFKRHDGAEIYYRPRIVSLDAFDAQPIVCDLPQVVEKGWQVFYRLGDLPQHCRKLRMFVRHPNEDGWHEELAEMDENILVPAFKETVLEHESPVRPTHSAIATHLRQLADYVGDARPPSLGLRENVQTWPESRGVPRRRSDVRIGINIHRAASGVTLDDLKCPLPRDTVIRLLMAAPTAMRLHDQGCRPILVKPSGALLTTGSAVNPASSRRIKLIGKGVGGDGGMLLSTGFAVHASSSARVLGRNSRGVTTDSRDCVTVFQSSDGGHVWRHHSTIPYNTLDGYQVVQAHISADMPAGNWMAMLRTAGAKTAGSPLLLTRSYDDGHTWTQPCPIRPSSVNPVGGLLDNGVAFRIYGRPGQFITFCSDGEGREWGNDVTLVPPPEPAGPESSCCNSSAYPVGPSRFIVVYTNYSYRDHQGQVRKAVLAREIAAERTGQ